MTGGDAQRIDKWLWHARFARTRTAAQRLVLDGAVRVNRDKVTAASRLVRPGDVLTLAAGRGVRVLRILALAGRRGSTAEAGLLFEDLSEARRSAPSAAGAAPPLPGPADSGDESAKSGRGEN